MNIAISNGNPEPIYSQITQQIKIKILKGEIKPGQMLPSMRLLAKSLRVSVITTKRAYEDLEREGFIVTVPGKGSFVSEKKKEEILEEEKKRVEEYIKKAVGVAKESRILQEDVIEMVKKWYGEEK